MKRYMIVITFLAIALTTQRCAKQKGEILSPYVKADGYLANQLAVDGCGWHIRLDLKDESVMLAPNDKSLQKIDQFVAKNGEFKNGLYSQKVEILYQTTGNKRKVTCGWGKQPEFDEIEISELSAR